MKGDEEEEYALPLKRESGCPIWVLRGRLKEGVRKVASEPGARKQVRLHALSPLADRTLVEVA